MGFEEWLEEHLEFKARFCLVTGLAPSEFDAMTDLEVDTFVEVYNDLNAAP